MTDEALTPEQLRERIAREIDPEAWRTPEQFEEYPSANKRRTRRKTETLDIATAILALLPSAQGKDGGEPTDRQLSNIARAIGATMRFTNHLERARAVWKAVWIDGERPYPTTALDAAPSKTERTPQDREYLLAQIDDISSNERLSQLERCNQIYELFDPINAGKE